GTSAAGVLAFCQGVSAKRRGASSDGGRGPYQTGRGGSPTGPDQHSHGSPASPSRGSGGGGTAGTRELARHRSIGDGPCRLGRPARAAAGLHGPGAIAAAQVLAANDAW